MANTTQITNDDVVQIQNTYNNTPIDAGMAGVCLITKGSGVSLKTYFSAEDAENDFGHDTYVTNFAKNYFDGGNPMFQVITYANGDDDDAAVNALRQYYDNGSEYIAFLATDDEKQTAIDIANLVESQGDKNCWIDIPTQPGQTPDFSGYAALKGNHTTVAISLPAFDPNVAHYQFLSAALSVRAGLDPNASLLSLHNLSGVIPQDKYAFQPDQLKVYKDAGILTYAYRNDVPMLTGSTSTSGYQISNAITRDYLNYQIKKDVTNYIINNSPTYDANGLNAIGDIIRAIMQDSQEKDYIENSDVKQPNASQISEAQKESGEVDGLGYSWTPTNNIDHIVLQSGIQLPALS